MQFLIVTKQSVPPPPEVAVQLLDAMFEWTKRYTGNGKVRETWGFAGQQGGGGILNVESFDELDTIMTEFPFAPFSTIEIYPLVDLIPSLERAKQVWQAASAGMGRRG